MSPEKLIAAAVLVSLTFSAGLEVNREHLFTMLKDIGLLGRALVANFVIVPVLGLLFVRLFALPPDIATGILLMAIAPGVPLILISVRKRGGSLALAVELSLFLPLLSLVTVPLTAQLLLPPEAVARLPLGHFVVTLLLFQTLPLLLGVVIGHRAPAAAPRLARIFRIVFLLTVLVLLVALAPKLAHSVSSVYGSRGMWAMLCIVVLSMLTGLALGGPARETRRVLGIATTLRNIGLAALIATANFPESSLVPAAVLTYLLIQFIVVMITGIYFTRTAERAPA